MEVQGERNFRTNSIDNPTRNKIKRWYYQQKIISLTLQNWSLYFIFVNAMKKVICLGGGATCVAEYDACNYLPYKNEIKWTGTHYHYKLQIITVSIPSFVLYLLRN